MVVLELVDFVKDGIDIVIRYGSGDYLNLIVEWFFVEKVILVCSLKLVGEIGCLWIFEDLKYFILIYDVSVDLEEIYFDWSMWLKVVKVEGVDGSRGFCFN